MILNLVRVLNVLMAALVVGTIFGIWLGYNPAGYSASTYVEQQQFAIIALNTLMPVLGFITILLTLTAAFLQRKEKNTFIFLIVAALFLIVSGLTTRFGNQPINSVVMTWDSKAPPANWTELRDKWWFYHQIRTASGLIGLGIITWTHLRKN